MNRDNAQLVAGVVDRITKLEKTIFEVQQLMNKDTFTIIGKIKNTLGVDNFNETIVKLNSDEIATVVFTQDILELYVSTLNLELDELIKQLDRF